MTRIKNQGPARHGRRSQDKRDKQERHPVDFRGWHSRLLLDRVDGLSKSQGTWTGRAGRPGRGGEKPFGPRCLWSRPRMRRWVAIDAAAPAIRADRKRVVEGKSVSVRVDRGGGVRIKKKKRN